MCIMPRKEYDDVIAERHLKEKLIKLAEERDRKIQFERSSKLVQAHLAYHGIGPGRIVSLFGNEVIINKFEESFPNHVRYKPTGGSSRTNSISPARLLYELVASDQIDCPSDCPYRQAEAK